MSMSKKIINDTIFSFDGQRKVTWKEIKEHLQKNAIVLHDDDILSGYYDNDTGEHVFHIERNRLETDEEYDRRREEEVRQENGRKESRRAQYFRLKAEFDGKESS